VDCNAERPCLTFSRLSDETPAVDIGGFGFAACSRV
jgi:hypothetical protein